MRLTTAAPIRAARELLPWIRKNYGSIPAFCEAKNISRITLQKAIRGDLKRIDVEFALAIKDATGGLIPVEWWIEPVTDEVMAVAIEEDDDEQAEAAPESEPDDAMAEPADEVSEVSAVVEPEHSLTDPKHAPSSSVPPAGANVPSVHPPKLDKGPAPTPDPDGTVF
jgi:hypothetical protein